MLVDLVYFFCYHFVDTFSSVYMFDSQECETVNNG